MCLCLCSDLPEISVSHSSVLATEGDNLTISCNGSGSPLPEVDWTVGGLHSINTHLSNVYWPNIHSINLNLFNISRDDNNFQLTCIAENEVGMTNSSIQVNVQFPPVILRLAEPEQRHDTCIEFTVRGYPQPKLRWFYKKKEIMQNKYIRTEMDFYQDYVEGCLTFQNPTHINNGNYTLEASNALGTVTKTVYGHFLTEPDTGVEKGGLKGWGAKNKIKRSAFHDEPPSRPLRCDLNIHVLQSNAPGSMAPCHKSAAVVWLRCFAANRSNKEGRSDPSPPSQAPSVYTQVHSFPSMLEYEAAAGAGGAGA
uniref:Ig-like domain-containing protein n=1 Tax=Knipowitschia caucasica TaxID=637954 RepID=A0AAV2LKN9_KNICA